MGSRMILAESLAFERGFAPRDFRSSLALMGLLLALIVGAFPAVAAVEVFHSADQSGVYPGNMVVIPPDPTHILHLYVENAGALTTAGAVCESGDGAELCGFDLVFEQVGGLQFLSFTPAGDVVHSLTSDRLRLNRLDAIAGATGAIYIGDLEVATGGILDAEVRLRASVALDAGLLEIDLPDRRIVLVPEPDLLSLLVGGIAFLSLLRGFRGKRRSNRNVLVDPVSPSLGSSPVHSMGLTRLAGQRELASVAMCVALFLFLATPAQAQYDADADGVPDAIDNCVFTANPGQEDGAGLFSTADGVGDACQCGDVDEDGDISLRDLAVYARAVDVGGPLAPGIANAQKCSVEGGPTDCTASDLQALRDSLAEQPNVVGNVCGAFVGMPTSPMGLLATAGDAEVLLDWTDVSTGLVSGYQVYRSLTPGSGFALVSGGPVLESSFIDAAVTNATTYYYVVTALANGETSFSNEVSVMPMSGTGPTTINSDIVVDTTWTRKGSPYTLTTTISVTSGATLTIEPGVTVRMVSGSSLLIGQSSNPGGMRALGSEIAPIQIIGTSAVPGHWREVDFGSATLTDTTVNHVTIQHAGGNSLAALGLTTVPAGPTFSHITIDTVLDDGVRVQGGAPALLDFDVTPNPGNRGLEIFQPTSGSFVNVAVSGGVEATTTSPNATFANLTFRDYAAGPSNRLHTDMVGSIMSNATIEGALATNVVRTTNGSVLRSAVWPKFNYRIESSMSIGATGSTPIVTLAPGVELRFNATRTLTVAPGSQTGGLIAAGTASDPIIFRGNTTSPNPGFWRNVSLFGGTATNSQLTHVLIQDAGSNSDTALELTDVPAGVSVSSVVIQDVANEGILVSRGAPVLSNLDVTPGSGFFGFTIFQVSDLSLTDSAISGGIEATSTSPNATFTNLTFRDYAAGPSSRLHTDMVGSVMSNATIEGALATNVVRTTNGSVLRSAVWPKFNYRIESSMSIGATGSTPIVTLAPGVELRFNATRTLTVAPGSQNGGLIAAGTASDPIIFRGNTTSPNPGFWRNVSLFGGTATNSQLTHVLIQDAGSNSDTALELTDVPAGVSVSNVVIQDVANEGILVSRGAPVLSNLDVRAGSGFFGFTIFQVSDLSLIDSAISGGIEATSTSPNATFTNLTFRDYAAGPSSRLHTDMVGSVMSNATIEGALATNVVRTTNGSVLRSAVWPKFNYRIESSMSIGATGSTPIVTLAPGVELRFNSARTLTVGTGSQTGGLIAAGTASDPIVFRGNTTSPNPGFWNNVSLLSGTTSSSQLTHVLIQDAGSNLSTALALSDVPAGVSVSNVVIQDVANEGILVSRGAPVLSNLDVTPGSGFFGFTIFQVSDLSLTDSVISGGLDAVSDSPNATFANLTFRDYAAGPSIRIHSDIVGQVMGSSTLAGAIPTSQVRVTSGRISRAAFWPKFNYRIQSSMTVYGNASTALTLAPGVELLFDSARNLIAGVNGPGALIADGTALEPIIFRGNTTSPNPGFWGGIELGADILPSSRLSHLTIQDAGSTSVDALLLRTVPKGVILENGIVRDVLNTGVRVIAGAPRLSGWDISGGPNDLAIESSNSSALHVTGSILRGPFQMTNGASNVVLTGNTFEDYSSSPWNRVVPDVVGPLVNENTFNGLVPGTSRIEVIAGTITRSATWKTGFVYRTLGSISVLSSDVPVLTLEGGTEVQFPSNGNIIVGNTTTPGGLMALGSVGNEILFTSTSAVPAPGQWQGLMFESESLDTSVLDHVTIEAAGNSGFFPGAVTLRNSAPTIRNSQIRNNSADGVNAIAGSPRIENTSFEGNGDDGFECDQASRPKIMDSVFLNNIDDGIVARCELLAERNAITGGDIGIRVRRVDPKLQLRNNNITGQTTRAIHNQDTANGIDARLNWFGTANAPTTEVSGLVETNPWLGAPFSGPFEADRSSISPESFAQGQTETHVHAHFSESASWTLDVFDSTATTVRSFAGISTDLDQPWLGDDALAVPLPDGLYDYQLVAQSSGGGMAGVSDIRGQMTLDSNLPIARIDQPTEVSVVLGGTLNVQGEVSGAGVTGYRLEYAAGSDPGDNAYVDVPGGTGSGPVSGTIANWNLSGLNAGFYTLRLVALAGAVEANDETLLKIFMQGTGTVTPSVISPNGDGLFDRATAASIFSIDTDWTIDVEDDSQNTVFTLTGEGPVVSAEWLGQGGAGTVPDGAYTLRLTATEAETGTQITSVLGTTEVDLTPPALAITDPISGGPLRQFGTFPVTGTANDLHPGTYTLSWAQGTPLPDFVAVTTRNGAVTNGNVGDLPADAPNNVQYDNGLLTLELSATDAAANSASTTTVVDVSRIFITNVGSAPAIIDPALGQSSTISYELGMPADVTVSLHPSGGGAAVRTLIADQARGVGGSSEVWDGLGDGAAEVDRGAYFPSIRASDGEGRETVWNPQDAPFTGTVAGFTGPAPLTFNGGSSTLPEIDLFQNEILRISYDRPVLTLGTLEVRPLGEPSFELVSAVPMPPGVNEVAVWDGRLPGGELFFGSFGLFVRDAVAADSAGIYVDVVELDLNSALVNPYAFKPMYSELANVRLDLPRSADLTIDVIDPDGNFLMNLVPLTTLAAGRHHFQWDGRDPNGDVVAVEGLYEVLINAQDVANGTSVSKRLNLSVVY